MFREKNSQRVTSPRYFCAACCNCRSVFWTRTNSSYTRNISGKLVPNYLHDEYGFMTHWRVNCFKTKQIIENQFSQKMMCCNRFHPRCLFESLRNARKTTRKVGLIADIEGNEQLKKTDYSILQSLIEEFKFAGSNRIRCCEKNRRRKICDTLISQTKPHKTNPWIFLYTSDSPNTQCHCSK